MAARPTTGERSDSVFYGWYVVAGSFTVLLLGFACSRAYAAFLPAFRDRFHADRTEVSLVFSILTLLELGLGVVSGPIADRFGPRRVTLTGVVMAACGLLLASRAQSLWQVYVTYGVGVGFGIGLAYVPAVAAVQHWFVRQRGLATGIVVAGNGTGISIGAPVAAVIVGAVGWRGTFVVLALAMLVLGGGAAALIEGSPERRGLQPDGDTAEAAAAARLAHGASGGHVRLGEALHSSPFWLLFLGGVGAALAMYMAYGHLEPYAQDHGMSAVTGALLVGVIGAGSVVGRLVIGPLNDRWGRRRSLVAMFAGMTVAMVWWMAATNLGGLIAFAVPFGLCSGGFVALVPSLIADYYGTGSAGGIIGFVYAGAAIGAFAGPTVAGAIYDSRGSYVPAIALGAAFCAASMLCSLRLPEARGWRSDRAAALDAMPLPD